MEGIGMIKKRVEVFLKQNQPAHIVTNVDSWYNGYVINTFEDDDYFIFLDRKLGKVAIFYKDIIKFEFFTGDMESLKRVEKDGT
jgi:hypothetical protein